ncbi:MAG: DNA (cytosine-5-)-methyltransferase [Umezawaea sp.]
MTLTSGSLCSGYGGLDIAANAVFGTRTVWFSEIDDAAIKVHAHHWPHLPNLGDIRAVDWTSVPRVDVLTAGYPCQPFSLAGQRKGADDPRHLWPHIAEGIRVLRPGVVVLENVPGHRSKGFGDVLADLATLGYLVAWGSLRASDVGAPHRRDRVFVVAVDPTRVGFATGGSGLDFRASGHVDGQREQAVADPGYRVVAERSWASRRTTGERTSVGRELGRDRSLRPRTEDGHRLDWGEYSAAIDRWERVLGRPAPRPAIEGPHGRPKLSPRFTEWAMGLPDGWVSAVPGVSVNQALGLCGNGVVPLQGETAVRALVEVLTRAAICGVHTNTTEGVTGAH